MKTPTLLLSDYKKLGRLGKGGNADVSHAAKGETVVALKILRTHTPAFKKKKHRFIDETRSVLKVQDEIQGILPIIDYALPDAEGNYWYTMPVATPILDKFKTLSVDEKIQSVIDLANTMAALHARGIVHRDIKPSNLYFYNGNYRLGDFGLVDYPEKMDVTHTREDVGPKYSIAPEMKRYAKTADGKKADVYSLAKTLWMLLTSNDTGFEGIYIADDRLIGLSFREEFRTEHLVELESLLSDATKEDPDSRPTMSDFSQRLKKWLEIKNDWEQSRLSQWRFISQKLFGGMPPTSANWNDRQQVVDVLNLIGRMPSLNHMFYPSGGGLDFIGAKLATENDCICLETDPCGFVILKPSRLTAETFGKNIIWNYFRLELSTLKPVFETGQSDKCEELVTEDTPGHYISWKCGNYGYYDDDTPLPKGYRLVDRYFFGSFVFFCKGSIYNYIHGTYDARHNTMSAEEFRQYINDLKHKYDHFCNRLKDQNISDLPHRFASCIGEAERQQKRQADTNYTNAILAAAKLRSAFEDWVEKNLSFFDFSTLCKQQTNSGSKLAYYVRFFINRPMSVTALGHALNNRLLLYLTGRILSEREAQKSNLKKYALYSITDAKAVISDCFRLIQNKYGETSIVENSCTASDFFIIDVCRIAPPSHLFTKNEIEKAMRAADDSVNNVLVIDENGQAKVVPSSEDSSLYPVHHETWVAYNNYVGKYSKLNTLDDDYRGSLEGWLRHLQTGEPIYVDYVTLEQTESDLIAEIRKHYSTGAEERR